MYRLNQLVVHEIQMTSLLTSVLALVNNRFEGVFFDHTFSKLNTSVGLDIAKALVLSSRRQHTFDRLKAHV